VVDAQFFFPDGPAAAIIARALGLPLTIKARGSDIHYWATRPVLWRRFARRGPGCRDAGGVGGAEGRYGRAGLPEGKITVHYTGLDHSASK
jgi:hypothetical protein